MDVLTHFDVLVDLLDEGAHTDAAARIISKRIREHTDALSEEERAEIVAQLEAKAAAHQKGGLALQMTGLSFRVV